MDLNLYLYLFLFLLLVGLFVRSLVRGRQKEARKKDGHSVPGTGPVNPGADERGQGE